MQTKLGSLIEAWTNIVIGFSINWSANMIVLPWFGFDITPGKAFNIGLVFTAISLARSYALRRLFNRLDVKTSRYPARHYVVAGYAAVLFPLGALIFWLLWTH